MPPRSRSRPRLPKLKLDTNRNCGSVSVDECASNNITSGLKVGEIVNASILGSGTYGVIFSSKTTRSGAKGGSGSGKGGKGPDVAIKFVFRSHAHEQDSFLIDDMKRELQYSRIMGEVGLGPKIFDNFYYKFRAEQIDDIPGLRDLFNRIKSYKKIDDLMNLEPHTVVEMQCIIMEEYKYDCENLLRANYVSTLTKAKIIGQMCDIIERQTKYGIYCNDIKPSNFVVNLTNDGVPTVKMIDFGSEFCTKGSIYGSLKNNVIFYGDGNFGLTSIDLLVLTNIIQLFITSITTNFLKKLPFADISVVYESFRTPIVVKFFNYRYWKRVMAQYINYGVSVLQEGGSNPATVLIWYANNGVISQKMFRVNKNNENANSIIMYINTMLQNLYNYFVKGEITYITYCIKSRKTRDNINYKDVLIKTYDYNI